MNVTERLAALSPAKRAFALEALRKARAGRDEAAIPPRADAHAPVPLSFLQELLWHIERSESGAAYNVPAAMRVTGALDIPRLQGALDALVARHHVFRTTFHEADGRPLQVVEEPRAVELRVVDRRAIPEAERDALAVSMLRAAANVPFDLSRDLLVRALVVRFADDDHALLLEWHHAAWDLASRDIVFRELASLYDASADRPANLPALPLQYADFAAWQRARLTGTALDEMRAYWHEALAGVPAALEIPTDRPRSAAPSFVGARRSVALPRSLADRVTATGRAHGATPFVTFLAAFATLLHRYTGQSDIVVGSIFAGRGRAELAQVVGCFSNAFPLRAQFEDDPIFADVLGRVRDSYLGAVEHTDVPLEMLDLPETPHLASVFTLVEENAAPALPMLGGLSLSPIALDRGVSKFELSFALRTTPETLRVVVEYRPDLFDASTIDRMLEHFALVLEAIAADAARPVSAIPLLTAGEREALALWNATAVAYRDDVTLHQLFEEQVARTPDAVAVEDETSVLSYAQLDGRANAVAGSLRKAGVTKGELVGICAERSVDMVAGLLGILKAGAAYVPFDPEYPAERLAFMLEDSGVRMLLADASLPCELSVAEERVIRLDGPLNARLDAAAGDGASPVASESNESRAAGATSAANATSADDPAYMIYTSGSTGRPKGVLNSHRGVCNRLQWGQDRYRLNASDVVLQKTPFSFDVSVPEFFWPLLSGARIVMARPGGHRDASYLVDLIVARGVTVVHFVPSMLRAFLAENDVERCVSLRHVMCSGEALSPDQPAAFFARLGAELHNLYGPTEAAVEVTHWTAPRDWREAFVPIGRPVANTQMYVLDAAGAPVPVGVAGELFIGGVQVGMGYHKRPELTAEKFVADPFAGSAHARLYRTGDRARYRSDGNLEYLGRLDYQVKLRGFRIELGEIETALLQYPALAAAIVILREDADTEPALVAYYVVSPAAEEPAAEVEPPSAAALRAHLRASLPDYMLPSFFVRLEALPLTPNGKLDRAALPIPDADSMVSASSFVAPRTPAEVKLAAIWAEVLKREGVGVHDDFFALGGHSLLAMRLLVRIESTFGVRVALRPFFEAPTIAALAEKLPSTDSAVVRAERIPRRESSAPARLSEAQETLWWLQHSDPEDSTYNIRIARRLRGALDVPALSRALDALVERHEALRMTFSTLEGEPRQAPGAARAVELAQVDLSGLAPAARTLEIDRVLHEFSARPFDLASDLLLRALLVKVSDDEHVLLLVSHHIVSDGSSIGVLLGDLSVSYAAATTGKVAALPPLPVQFVDFVTWQCDRLRGERREELLAYWRRQLADTPRLSLTTDNPRSAVPRFEGAHEVAFLPRSLSDDLQRLAQRENTTLFTILVTAYAALLHRYTAQDDIVVGAPVEGRDFPDLEGVVGYFVNMLPLRARFASDRTFRDMVAQMRETTLGAYEHQAMPIETLGRELHGFSGSASLFEAVFLFNSGDGTTTMGPIAATSVKFESGTAKLDIALSINEGSDGLRASLEYRKDLFEAATMARMLRHFGVLLAGIVANPDRPISRLPLLDPDETRVLLRERNATAAPFPRDCRLHELIEAQVRRTPGAVAVECETPAGGLATLTFAELDARAATLATHLRSLHVGPGVGVAICAERSPELVVAILGVLKSGGYYVPLDPDYPADRLAFMLADAAVPVLLTTEGLRASIPASGTSTSPVVLALDADWDRIVATPASQTSSADGSPEDLAYVIYTSGSTGRPKGVMIPHRAVVNYVTWMQRAYPVDLQDAVLQKAPASFDACIWEFFLPLVAGARLVLALPGGHTDPQYLLAAVKRHEVSILQLVPSQLQMMLESTTGEADRVLGSLRRLFLGGERLPPELLVRLVEVCPKLAVTNLYGPTEATVYATHWTLEPQEWSGGIVPIGRPIDNVSVYLLDAAGGPVPEGVPGELHIGGVGLAQGYLNRVELTAERFIPDPFSDDPAARLYRTGDLVRYGAGGRLEYLGRIDTQVKIRGFRVELGEIEAALMGAPEIDSAVVLVKETTPGDQRLIAFALAAGGSALSEGDRTALVLNLRQRLKATLPDYMVPSTFAWVEDWPLSPNGKLDRAALAARDVAEVAATTAFVAPRTPTEEKLAAIWAEVLKRERIGVDDDFFALGGHSLLAMRIVSRVVTACGVRVSLNLVFEHPTIAELALRVDERLAAGALSSDGPALVRIPRTALRRPALKGPSAEDVPL